MQKRFENKKIILGVCGGIAAYKTVELARMLQQEGALVQVVMTESAQEFIGAQTFQAVTGFPVWTATNDASFERSMAHIDLSRWADMLIIAPATANFMAKMTYGMADDLLSLICLMVQAPIVVCPAMNVNMWQHPATLHNSAILEQRGIYLVGPDVGSQACGDVGAGRMREPEWIMNAIDLLPIYNCLKGMHFVLTAGATREAIDPVRFISNRSSGRMGYALAEALVFAGAKVSLISGPCHQMLPPGVEAHFVNTAQEMFDGVKAILKPTDIFIGVAAVADYRVAQPSKQKIKKNQSNSLNLELEKTTDILATVKQQKLAKCVVGFAAETHDVLAYAKEKLYNKADVIIANQVSENKGFEQNNNAVTILTSQDEIHLFEASKLIIAKQCVEFLKKYLKD
jgi:phosphopantothenoylcysteine decarboxylase/phosphopantothenate--cysteine ligase